MWMKWHINKVGSHWLELEETLEVTNSNEGKSDKILPQNRLYKKTQMLLAPYFLTHEHFAELTETPLCRSTHTSKLEIRRHQYG